MNFSPIPRDFYQPSADIVAPALLGHFLLRRIENEWVGGEIVETEAYLADDPACHAYVRETERNRVMWGQEGRAYVFRIYGSYQCVNAVCRPAGSAEAVLIRAVEPRFGVEIMRQNRVVAKDVELSNGPSKLCIAMNIMGAHNGLDLTDAESPLVIAQNPERESFLSLRAPTIQTTRIGLTKAADWPLRWILGGSKSISRRGLPTQWPELTA
ncbi:MAG TPA: DNA-3-methyladenine glycosylase [Abditibacterium sp.]|jgi:DNA-3-methyladenine glycosylase